jgi:hypothetical protein
MIRYFVILILFIMVACDRSASNRPAPAAGHTQAESMRARASRDSFLAAHKADSLVYVRWSLPKIARSALGAAENRERYDLFLDLNPYYQRGRFDGDSISDVAVQIIEKASGKRGIMIIHGGDSSVRVLGAGTAFGNGGDDFSWLWVWRVESHELRRDVNPLGIEMLYVEKPESAGGVIWWDGSQYVWTQHGD